MFAEERYAGLQGYFETAKTSLLEAAIPLHCAYEEKDYVHLGMETWAQYLDSLGISRSQDSKLRKVAYVFGGAETWVLVGKNPEVTLERLYLASRLQQREDLEPLAAFALAASTPSHELVAMLKGEELEPTMCACPECGHSHRRKEAA